MTLEKSYQKIRAAVRELGCRESLYVIWAYCQYLQVDHFQIPSNIEVNRKFLDATVPIALIAEFNLEQLAREVIRHADIEPRRGRTLRRWATLAEIIDDLKDLENEIYGEFQRGSSVQLEMMRIAHRQFVWQQFRLNWRPIIRYYKLFSQSEIVSCTIDATGLNLKEIYILGMSYIGKFLKAPRVKSIIDIEIPGITQVHIDKFLAFTSLNRNALAKRLRAEHALDEGYAYRYSSLREFPLVRMSYLGQEEVACPLPTLLFWRITTGLYYTLMDRPGFLTAFGSSFQRYVGEVLHAGLSSQNRLILEEKEYYIGRDRKDTVDWIVQQGNSAALFIECKTKRLTWASKSAIIDLTALQKDIEKLADAVVQVYKTISDYCNGFYHQLPFSKELQVFPVVVTLEDWYIFGHEMQVRLDASVRAKLVAAGLPEGWLKNMPYSILSIDDLEKIVGAINLIDIDRLVLEKARDAEYSKWGFASYCSDRYSRELSLVPPLFKDEYDTMFTSLA